MITAKEGRRASREKALRLTQGDPRKKVDASSWTPPEALNAGRKTGARPVRPRIYKHGGKIQGDRADRHPGKSPRSAHASGGKVGTGPLSMANVAQENKDEFGSYHQGAYKRGGAPKAGQDMAAMKVMVHKHEKHDHKGEALTKLKSGGGTYFGGTRPTGGRVPKARGGRAKGKTNINIVIQQPKPDQSQLPPQGVVRPPPPPMPPPQMPPPAAGGPPGGAPMAGPPGAGGLPPGGPMPRKRGGKVYRSAKDMDAGAKSGLGRLEKTEIQEHRR